MRKSKMCEGISDARGTWGKRDVIARVFMHLIYSAKIYLGLTIY